MAEEIGVRAITITGKVVLEHWLVTKGVVTLVGQAIAEGFEDFEGMTDMGVDANL